MPMYDRECQTCKKITLDHFEVINLEVQPTCECGGPTVRVFTSHANNVIGDDIPGGIEIRHGICNEDGSPRRYYSKSEMAKEAKRRGLTNQVTHVTPQGTDKSPHTSRWI